MTCLCHLTERKMLGEFHLLINFYYTHKFYILKFLMTLDTDDTNDTPLLFFGTSLNQFGLLVLASSNSLTSASPG